MATYAKASYNAAKYAANRPTYPPQLFDLLFRYHERGAKARFDTAVDVGCGPGQAQFVSLPICELSFVGQATLELTPFKRIIGVDPSDTMIQQARNNLKATGCPREVEYKQSSAENLAILADDSVDLMLSGERSMLFQLHPCI